MADEQPGAARGGADEERPVPAEDLTALCRDILAAAGLPDGDAALAASAIVAADLRGAPSHGVRLLPGYVARLRAGGINPRPRLRVTREGPAVALLDGDHGMGHVVAARAMDLAIEKARACGIGACAAAHSGHFGIAAFYALRALDRGMIGLATTNSVAVIPPPGGAAGRVGNTATAYALPAQEEPPPVLDIAMSAAARAKILLYAARDEPIPDDWALDRAGAPTTDPHAAAEGWLLPAGGHKGFGLALLWDALAGVLSGSRFGPQVVRPADDERTDIGHFMLALDVAAFGDPADFRARIDDVVRGIRETPRRPGGEEPRAPGERSGALRRRRLAEGVPLPAAVIAALNRLAAGQGVAARL
ncbi:MAG TPA: Ldh family oxidoreductase [Thermomicrobiales bacterium]|nr:Ldh family oxidoreductase [Thermomicrobiales bacterium]